MADHSDYKIEFYWLGRKTKHKRYDSYQSYLTYWKYHTNNIMFPEQALLGWVSGKKERVYP